MSEELKKFIEENGFIVMDATEHSIRCGLPGDVFKDADGHIWHVDDIADWMLDLQNEKARDSVDWLT